jgi:DNA-binding MarR family transcriptional regulator
MTEYIHTSESLGKWISIVYRYAHTFFDQKLAHANVSSGLVPFIYHIFRSDGLSQDELSEMIGMDKTTTARAIKTLVNLGYVSRNRDRDDRRIFRLYLTIKGRALIPEIKQVMAEWTSVISHGLSQEDKSKLEQALRRMAENAKKFKEGDYKGPANRTV